MGSDIRSPALAATPRKRRCCRIAAITVLGSLAGIQLAALAGAFSPPPPDPVLPADEMVPAWRSAIASAATSPFAVGVAQLGADVLLVSVEPARSDGQGFECRRYRTLLVTQEGMTNMARGPAFICRGLSVSGGLPAGGWRIVHDPILARLLPPSAFDRYSAKRAGNLHGQGRRPPGSMPGGTGLDI